MPGSNCNHCHSPSSHRLLHHPRRHPASVSDPNDSLIHAPHDLSRFDTLSSFLNTTPSNRGGHRHATQPFNPPKPRLQQRLSRIGHHSPPGCAKCSGLYADPCHSSNDTLFNSHITKSTQPSLKTKRLTTHLNNKRHTPRHFLVSSDLFCSPVCFCLCHLERL